MKSLIVASFFSLVLAIPGQASEVYVPTEKAESLFNAAAAAFPMSRRGENKSEFVFLEKFSCIQTPDEDRCAILIGNEVVSLKGGDTEDSPDNNARLNALWNAMEGAGLPLEKGQDYSAIKLEYLTCDHWMPTGAEEESYSCAYKK